HDVFSMGLLVGDLQDVKPLRAHEDDEARSGSAMCETVGEVGKRQTRAQPAAPAPLRPIAGTAESGTNRVESADHRDGQDVTPAYLIESGGLQQARAGPEVNT